MTENKITDDEKENLNANTDEVETDSDKKLDYSGGVLENEIVIPSGRHDGKGTRLIVMYRAGRNPI